MYPSLSTPVKEFHCTLQPLRRYNIYFVDNLGPGRLFPFLMCLALLAGVPARTQSPAPAGPAPQAPVSTPDLKKAKQSYEKGLRAEKDQDWAAAFENYAAAVERAPDNREYLVHRDIARSRLVQQHAERAERYAAMGRLEEARGELRAAIQLDPGDAVVQQRLEQLTVMEPGAVRQLPEPGGQVHLQSLPGTRSFDYRGDTLGAYAQVAKQFGVSAAFDVDLRPRRVHFRFDDLDFETALRLLGAMTSTFWRPLTSKLFFVAQDTAQKQRDYQDSIARTVLLPASVTNDEMVELLRVVREVTGIHRTELDLPGRTLTLRDSPQAVAVATQLIEDLQKAPGEMILEIETLEVNRDAARRLGVTPPETSRLVTLNRQQVQEAQQSLQGLIDVATQVFGLPSSLSGVSTSQLGSLIGSGQLGASALIPPLIVFGGGGSTFLATLPGAAASFSDTLSLVRTGRRILLRAQDSQPATFFVGDRVPISLALFSSSLASSQFFPNVGQSSFPRTDFATGTNPVALVAASLNSLNDSFQDLAVVNQKDSPPDLSILLNDGTGTFSLKSPSPAAGVMPVAIAAGDFNGDGKTDLAVVDQGDATHTPTVSVLLGKGDGTFTTGTPLATGKMPVAIVTGDFNGDGVLDLAVVNQKDNTVSIFLGNTVMGHGNGTFTLKSSPATGVTPVAIAAGDFNGDGETDLAVVNQGDSTHTPSVSILLGKGDGTFTLQSTLATGNTPSAIATADFNADGLLDLAVTNQADNTVSIFLGNLSNPGTFSAKTDFITGTAPVALATGDFNVDGRPDLAVANQSDSTVSILVGLGDGTFAPKFDVTTGTGPVGIVSTDFNGDNTPDVATANQTANTVSVILNTATFQTASATPQTFFPGVQYVDVGLKLKATPRLHGNDEVTLKLSFEISSLSGQAVNGIPIITSRTIEQTVRLRQDETSALAGIINRQEMRSINGSPGFATITGAGLLAGNRSTDAQDSELLILITPRLIRLAPRVDHSFYAGHAGGSSSTSGSSEEGPPQPLQPQPVQPQPGQPQPRQPQL